MMEKRLPICVDLDGTLIQGDVLNESLEIFLKNWPWKIFLLPFWLLKGRAFLKKKVAERVDLEIEKLALNEEFYRYLLGLKKQGHILYLITAADEKYARQVAQTYPLFEEVMSSRGKENLRSRNKAEALVRRFGEKGFVYAGNSRHDLPVWRRAGGVIAVNLPWYLKPVIGKLYPDAKRFN